MNQHGYCRHCAAAYAVVGITTRNGVRYCNNCGARTMQTTRERRQRERTAHRDVWPAGIDHA